MTHTPPPPDPDRTLRRVLAVVGVAAGVAGMVLGTVLMPNAGGNKWVYAPVWGLPAFWAAGVLWLLRPVEVKRYSQAEVVASGAAFVAVFTTALLVIGLVADWVRLGMTQVAITTSRVTPMPFFTCCGWPAGVICLPVLLVLLGKQVFRAFAADDADPPTTE